MNRRSAFALLAICCAAALFMAAARPSAQPPAAQNFKQFPAAPSAAVDETQALAALLVRLEELDAIKQAYPAPGQAFVALEEVPLPAAMQRKIHGLCAEAGVPFPVVMALIWKESRFQPAVVSPTGDHGLMQVNAGNFGWLRQALGGIDFHDPIENVRAGLHILGPLWAKYGAEEPHKALMAYNLGPTGAARRWAAGQYDTAYSRNVLHQAAAYGY